MCVALVANVVLDEPFTLTQLAGYGALIAGILLIFSERPVRDAEEPNGHQR